MAKNLATIQISTWGIMRERQGCKVGVIHIFDLLKLTDFSEWMRAQPTNPTAWTVINSGPYIEMLHEFLLPQEGDDGIIRFNLPIGQGAVPFIHLDDFARYVPWVFSNPAESNGMILQIATAHVSGPELAKAFTAVTGKKAEYVDTPA